MHTSVQDNNLMAEAEQNRGSLLTSVICSLTELLLRVCFRCRGLKYGSLRCLSLACATARKIRKYR